MKSALQSIDHCVYDNKMVFRMKISITEKSVKYVSIKEMQCHPGKVGGHVFWSHHSVTSSVMEWGLQKTWQLTFPG